MFKSTRPKENENGNFQTSKMQREFESKGDLRLIKQYSAYICTMRQVPQHKLNQAQLNLIKSFQYLSDEGEISEIDSLINFYLEKRLDAAIEKVESQKNYTAAVYEQWLNEQGKAGK